MSAQSQAVGTKLKDKNPAPNGVLEVTVQGKLGNPGIAPETITLTNGVHTVRWRCAGLLRGSRLEIHFPENPEGPFVDLFDTPVAPDEVVGFGNRGPRETEKEYTYEARVVRRTGRKRVVGSGRVLNKATKRINHPGAGGIDTQPEPINT